MPTGIDAARFRKSSHNGQPAEKKKMTFADPDYWEVRYNETQFEAYDWYLKWLGLKNILAPVLSTESQVLMVGCGTSSLSDEMYLEGYTNITNIDRCDVVINAVAERNQDKASMRYQVMDALEMPEDWTGFYDVIIDKACLDAVMCGKDGKASASKMLKNVSRCLKPGTGVYVCVSGGKPVLRKPLFLGSVQHGDVSEEYGWKVDMEACSKPLEGKIKESPAFNGEECCYHTYICRRH